MAFALSEGEPIDADRRVTALRVDIKNITVHMIKSVKFESQEFRVSRRRWEKRNSEF
jgi:hypothetical protein